jgi:hypothetical protein
MTLLLREFSGYGAASLLAISADVTLLWVLVQFCALNYLARRLLTSSRINIACGERRLQNRRSEFVWFVAIGTVGLATNAAVMVLAVRLPSLDYLLAKCAAAGFTFLGNFIARRQFLFFVRSTARNAHS